MRTAFLGMFRDLNDVAQRQKLFAVRRERNWLVGTSVSPRLGGNQANQEVGENFQPFVS